MKHVKYQRTKHFPYSPGIGSDDKVMQDLSHFYNKEIIITEKMDGECTTLYKDGLHARSLSSSNHPSRTWIKNLHASIAHLIPDNLRICGENLYSVHSIFYDALPSYFMVFGIYDEEKCLSWVETENICQELGLITVPILRKGIYNQANVYYTGMSECGGEQEGYVMRLSESFPVDETDWIVKWVRKNHVKSSNHWMHDEMKINRLWIYDDE